MLAQHRYAESNWVLKGEGMHDGCAMLKRFVFICKGGKKNAWFPYNKCTNRRFSLL